MLKDKPKTSDELEVKGVKALRDRGAVKVMLAKSHSERAVFQNIFRESSVTVIVVGDNVKTRVAFSGKKTRWNRHFWTGENWKITVNLKES